MKLLGKFPQQEEKEILKEVHMQLPKDVLKAIDKICLEHGRHLKRGKIPRQRLIAAMLRKFLESDLEIDLETEV